MIHQLVGGLRAGMGYCGCGNIPALQKEARLIKITAGRLPREPRPRRDDYEGSAELSVRIEVRPCSGFDDYGGSSPPRSSIFTVTLPSNGRGSRSAHSTATTAPLASSSSPRSSTAAAALETVQVDVRQRHAPSVVLHEHERRARDFVGIGAEAGGQSADERRLSGAQIAMQQHERARLQRPRQPSRRVRMFPASDLVVTISGLAIGRLHAAARGQLEHGVAEMRREIAGRHRHFALVGFGEIAGERVQVDAQSCTPLRRRAAAPATRQARRSAHRRCRRSPCRDCPAG